MRAEPDLAELTYPELADLLHERVAARYVRYWDEADARSDAPLHRLATAGAGLERDAWPEALASSIGPLLITDGDIGGSSRGVHVPVLLEGLSRRPSQLQVWFWDWGADGQGSQVDLVFPYANAEGAGVGSQHVGIYLGAQPYLQRSVVLRGLGETGYEGHARSGTHEISREQYRFFLDLLVA